MSNDEALTTEAAPSTPVQQAPSKRSKKKSKRTKTKKKNDDHHHHHHSPRRSVSLQQAHLSKSLQLERDEEEVIAAASSKKKSKTATTTKRGGVPRASSTNSPHIRSSSSSSSSDGSNNSPSSRVSPVGSATRMLDQMEQNFQSGLLRKIADRKAAQEEEQAAAASSVVPAVPDLDHGGESQTSAIMSHSPSNNHKKCSSPPTTPTSTTVSVSSQSSQPSPLPSPPLVKANESDPEKSPSQQELVLEAAKKSDHPARRLLLKTRTASANITKEERLEMTVTRLTMQLEEMSHDRENLRATVTDLRQQLAEQTAKVQALEYTFSIMNQGGRSNIVNKEQLLQGDGGHHGKNHSVGSMSETERMSDSCGSFSDNTSFGSFDHVTDDQSAAYYEQQQQQHRQEYAQDYEVFEPPAEKLSVSFQKTGAKVRQAKVQAAAKLATLTFI